MKVVKRKNDAALANHGRKAKKAKHYVCLNPPETPFASIFETSFINNLGMKIILMLSIRSILRLKICSKKVYKNFPLYWIKKWALANRHYWFFGVFPRNKPLWFQFNKTTKRFILSPEKISPSSSYSVHKVKVTVLEQCYAYIESQEKEKNEDDPHRMPEDMKQFHKLWKKDDKQIMLCEIFDIYQMCDNSSEHLFQHFKLHWMKHFDHNAMVKYLRILRIWYYGSIKIRYNRLYMYLHLSLGAHCTNIQIIMSIQSVGFVPVNTHELEKLQKERDNFLNIILGDLSKRREVSQGFIKAKKEGIDDLPIYCMEGGVSLSWVLLDNITRFIFESTSMSVLRGDTVSIGPYSRFFKDYELDTVHSY